MNQPAASQSPGRVQPTVATDDNPKLSLLIAVGEVAELAVGRHLGEDTFQEILRLVGPAVQASRMLLGELKKAGETPVLARAYEWFAPESESRTAPRHRPLQDGGDAWCQWADVLSTGQVVHGNVRDFPEEQRAFLTERGITSLAIIPIARRRGLWGFLAVADDLTARAWPEETLDLLRRISRLVGAALDRCDLCRRQQAIEASYHSLLDNLNEVIFKTDERGNFIYLSAAWRTLIGGAPSDALGKFCGNFAVREDRRANRQSLRALLRGELAEHRCEVRLRRSDDGIRWVQVSTRQLELPGLQRSGLVGTIVDISAIKAVESELRAAKRAAEAANRAKSEFLSTMSHELRTPLNAVIGLSESLLETELEPDAERTRRFLGLIHGAGKQLFRQVNDILDLARIEAGRFRLNVGPIEVGSLCAAACETLRKDALAKELRLEVDRPAVPLLIEADERVIGQALHNILLNAVKFTPAGGRVTVVATRSASGGACVTVTDTGIGIPAEKLHLLFKPFTQVDSSLARRFGGTGIGLVLVEKYVRLHGGSVTVTSQLGQGSSFSLLLPPRPDQSAELLTAAGDENTLPVK